jgi:predicted CXXCH cytochrome family protein
METTRISPAAGLARLSLRVEAMKCPESAGSYRAPTTVRRSRRAALVAMAALLLSSTTAASGAVSAVSGHETCGLRSADRATARSRWCLSCHDGSMASHVGNRPGGVEVGTHPVDVSYREAASRNRRLHPQFQVSQRLSLPEGKVTCLSCHDGASGQPKHVALPMTRSELCFTCHDI